MMMVAAICVGVVLIGAALGLGMVGELSVWQRALCALPCILLAPLGFIRTVRVQKTYRIDISGSGQIRLFPQQTSHADKNPGHVGTLVSLLPHSTLWPHFLLLRLRAEDGQVHVLPILPDCVSPDSMRAVAVACRWITAHNLHL